MKHFRASDTEGEIGLCRNNTEPEMKSVTILFPFHLSKTAPYTLYHCSDIGGAQPFLSLQEHPADCAFGPGAYGKYQGLGAPLPCLCSYTCPFTYHSPAA